MRRKQKYRYIRLSGYHRGIIHNSEFIIFINLKNTFTEGRICNSDRLATNLQGLLAIRKIEHKT